MGAGFLSLYRPRTHGVICDRCHAQAGLVLLQGGPVYVEHRCAWRAHGLWRRRIARLVIVPDPVTGRIKQIPVANREDGATRLRLEAETWLLGLSELFGVPIPEPAA